MDIKETLINLGYSNIKDMGSEYRTRPIYRESDNNTTLRIKKTQDSLQTSLDKSLARLKN